MLLERHPAVWHLKLLATSCRVVSFGAGAVILNWLIDQAARAEVHLAADFRRTDRNRMMEIAYRFAGFTDEDCGCMAALGTGGNGQGGAAGTHIERMHLIPARRSEPATMRLISPDLASYARG
jgi:methoxymalonate biosynthesis protein